MSVSLSAVESIGEVRRRRLEQPGSVGFVPTMGALHEGHARLIDVARAECDRVVVSIFVNPLQFDRDDDLRRYPRTLDADLQLCARHGVDLVFAPRAEEMYPQPLACRVDVGSLADHLCGPFRPGHFAGVATVVLKLLEIVDPTRAYFGEKDAQQLVIVKRLVSDFNLRPAIVGVPTVREADGLAMSSRNAHLDAGERLLAPSLHRALVEARDAVARGVTASSEVFDAATRAIPVDERVRLEYLEIVDPATLQPVDVVDRPVLVAGALWVGATRLIDNLLCTPFR
jgi:pantoate--beta-alanine ligase